jgi:GTP-dependent phosphoenolpyruvate carboxykinase
MDTFVSEACTLTDNDYLLAPRSFIKRRGKMVLEAFNVHGRWFLRVLVRVGATLVERFMRRVDFRALLGV